jgi:deazaflavin-dependent oxidoreductase (nitroreductase family)
MSPATSVIERPPGRLLRAALRVPTLLYRARLGWLLGRRFLCIAHRGRRTGRLRRTVVEVVRIDPNIPEAFVVAAWGPRTQWLRNLEAAPAEEVRIGRSSWIRPRQRFIPQLERAELLQNYIRDHPVAAREIGRVLGLPRHPDHDAISEVAARIRAVAFRPP